MTTYLPIANDEKFKLSIGSHGATITLPMKQFTWWKKNLSHIHTQIV